MTREEAKRAFAALVKQHGLQWTARQNIPQTSWDKLAECNKVLTENDRREALGLRT